MINIFHHPISASCTSLSKGPILHYHTTYIIYYTYKQASKMFELKPYPMVGIQISRV